MAKKGEQTHDTGKTGLQPSQSVNKAERRKTNSRVHQCAMALGVSFVSTETKEMLQPQDVHWFRDANKVRQNISWQCQSSCEISSHTQDTLTCRIVPPGVDGKRSSNAADPKDFQNNCIEGAVAVLGSVLLGLVLCCVISLWRKRRR